MAQLVKNPPVMWETWIEVYDQNYWVGQNKLFGQPILNTWKGIWHTLDKAKIPK